MSKNETSKYNEYEVLRTLRKKKSLTVNEQYVAVQANNKAWIPARSITISTMGTFSEADTVGIKTKGKIDYLRKKCGFTVLYTA